MSYDLMVFDPDAAPRERARFVEWYRQQTDWSDGDDAFDPATTSDALRNWYEAMLPAWPDMQEATDEQADDPHVTGYSFGKHVIYVDFRWSVADAAYEAVRSSAVAHRIGFYDVSGDDGNGEIYFPGATPEPPSDGAWRDMAEQAALYEKNTPAPPKASWFDFFRRKQ